MWEFLFKDINPQNLIKELCQLSLDCAAMVGIVTLKIF